MAYNSKKKSVFLKDGISSRDLEKGAEFEIEQKDLDSSSEEDYFDDEELKDFKSELVRQTNKDISEVGLESLTLEDMREKMTPLTDDGLVSKLVITYGTGIIIPPKSIVLMHYNAYIGNEKQPFDSSYLRANPHKFLLGAGRTVLGLDIAVGSMKKGEISKFIVDSDYAYGEMGCPPRIPPNATITYKVEILSFIESAVALEYEEMTPEEQHKAPFAKVFAVSKLEHQMGKDMFIKKKYFPAAGRFLRAVRLLEDVSASDEEEDTQRQSFLLKLYVNLAICFVNVKKSKRAIFYAQKALGMDENNGKALYQLGCAYLIDREYDQSRCYLLRAREKYPYNAEINTKLIQLENSQAHYNAFNKEYCKRMFRHSTEEEKEKKPRLAESKEFIEVIENQVKKFKNSSDKEYLFSPGFTVSQIEVIKSIAESHGLNFLVKIFNKQKIIKMTKKPV